MSFGPHTHFDALFTSILGADGNETVNIEIAKEDEKDEKKGYSHGVSVTTKEVDSAARVSLGVHGQIDPKEANRIR